MQLYPLLLNRQALLPQKLVKLPQARLLPLPVPLMPAVLQQMQARLLLLHHLKQQLLQPKLTKLLIPQMPQLVQQALLLLQHLPLPSLLPQPIVLLCRQWLPKLQN
jgi:hypothetical protein